MVYYDILRVILTLLPTSWKRQPVGHARGRADNNSNIIIIIIIIIMIVMIIILMLLIAL